MDIKELMDVMIFHDGKSTSIINVEKNNYISALKRFYKIKGKNIDIDEIRQYNHDKSEYEDKIIIGKELKELINQIKS